MKTKILTLGLICLFIFAYCTSPADPQIEKALNPGNPGNSSLLAIASFTATHQISHFMADHQQSTEQGGWWSSSFILSWSVTNATTVSIDQGIGEVEAVGTETVQIRSTIAMTTYILTATNGEGQITASCVAEHPKHAVLEITTIPELPVFYYYSDPAFDNSQSTFTIVITETNGVGGYFHSRLDYDTPGCGWPFGKEIIEPFGTVSIIAIACANQRPTTMAIWIEGWDNNNCEIDVQVNIPFIIEN